MFSVYILQNSKGILYKGYTSDLEKRLNQHATDDGFISSTHGRGPWKLVYKEEFVSEKDAKFREQYFKSGKGREFLKIAIGRLSA